MLITRCIACRYGRHERHVEVVQWVPKGMYGGARCYCEGECAERWVRARQAHVGAALANPARSEAEGSS